MQPIQLSLVIGEKGSGVSTLLSVFAQRADMQDTLIVDGPGPAKTWDTEAFVDWLRDHRTGRASCASIVFAADDLSAPRHLLQALAEPELGATFRLSAVTGAASSLTWSEAAEGARAGSEGTAEGEEARGAEIIADPQRRRFFATVDRIILTHTDRVRPGAVTRLAKALKVLNPPAPILRARNGDIGPARLVDSGLFDPVTSAIDIDRWLCEAAFGFEAARRGGPNLPRSPLARLNNDAGIRHFAVTIDQPLDGAVLSVFLKLLMADRSTGLLRLKGIVATEDHPDRPALIDGRDHLIQPLLWLETWPTADRRGRLVFVTANASEDWIRTLLTTLTDQLKLQEMPELQLAMVEKVG